jgi:hypothetical protein
MGAESYIAALVEFHSSLRARQQVAEKASNLKSQVTRLKSAAESGQILDS